MVIHVPMRAWGWTGRGLLGMVVGEERSPSECDPIIEPESESGNLGDGSRDVASIAREIAAEAGSTLCQIGTGDN